MFSDYEKYSQTPLATEIFLSSLFVFEFGRLLVYIVPSFAAGAAEGGPNARGGNSGESVRLRFGYRYTNLEDPPGDWQVEERFWLSNCSYIYSLTDRRAWFPLLVVGKYDE